MIILHGIIGESYLNSNLILQFTTVSFQLTMIIAKFEVDGWVPSADVEVGNGTIFCVPKSRGNRGAVFHQFRNTSTQTAIAGMRKIQQVMMPKIIVTQTYATLRCGWPGRIISITASQISAPPITKHITPENAQTMTYILSFQDTDPHIIAKRN